MNNTSVRLIEKSHWARKRVYESEQKKVLISEMNQKGDRKKTGVQVWQSLREKKSEEEHK